MNVTVDQAVTGLINVISYMEAHPPVLDKQMQILLELLSHLNNNKTSLEHKGKSHPEGSERCEHLGHVIKADQDESSINKVQCILVLHKAKQSHIYTHDNRDDSPDHVDMVNVVREEIVCLNNSGIDMDISENVTDDESEMEGNIIQTKKPNTKRRPDSVSPKKMRRSRSKKVPNTDSLNQDILRCNSAPERVVAGTSHACPVCDRELRTHKGLKSHVLCHNGAISIHGGPYGEHQCIICGCVCSTADDLENHMVVHKYFTCGTCGKQYSDSKRFNRHVRIHVEDERFACTVCCKSFTAPGHLKEHVNIHTGKKPYVCHTCGKAFIYRKSLRIHRKTHSEDRPHKCQQCEKSFKYKSSLLYHIKLHSNNRPYLCNICGKSFFEPTPLKVHMVVHTKERPFTCKFCEKSFSYQSSLRAHLKFHSTD